MKKEFYYLLYYQNLGLKWASYGSWEEITARHWVNAKIDRNMGGEMEQDAETNGG